MRHGRGEAWIEKWFAAWDLTSRRILRLPDAPAPEIVFYDSSCVYTTSALTAGAAPPENGPALRGHTLPWRALAHHDSLTLPDSTRVPVQLMSFTKSAKGTGLFFVMAAPSLWAQVVPGPDAGLPVFLHEFTHTRQVGGFRTHPWPDRFDMGVPRGIEEQRRASPLRQGLRLHGRLPGGARLCSIAPRTPARSRRFARWLNARWR